MRHFERIVNAFKQVRGTAQERLLAPEQFRAQLTRERARTGRSGAPFTVLVFDVDPSQGDPLRDRAFRVLASVLLDRTRASDTKGWLADRLAIILPHTTAGEADAVWHTICEAYKNRMFGELAGQLPLPQVSYEIYGYPDNGPDRAETGIDQWFETHFGTSVAQGGPS